MSRSLTEKTMVAILAAGKGTRMGRDDLAKVCFEIDGIPAINRIIATCKKKGFQKFLLVVGSKAGQVMETVSAEHRGVTFVFQTPQLGTGHAAKIAAEALQSLGHQDPVLLTMGDKYLEEAALDILVDGFIRRQADFALLTIPKTSRTRGSGGRVFVKSNHHAIAIFERIDIAKQAIADELGKMLKTGDPLPAEKITQILRKHIPSGKKQNLAVPEISKIIRKNTSVSRKKLQQILSKKEYNTTINNKHYSAKQIEDKCQGINPSLYLVRADSFYSGVSLLTNQNAQREYYLTDIVGILANPENMPPGKKLRVIAVPTDNDRLIQGFNSPDELLTIQDYVRRRKFSNQKISLVSPQKRLKKREYDTVAHWIQRFEKNGPTLTRWFQKIYGDHPVLHKRKRSAFVKVLKNYGKEFGLNQKVVIVRAPGRVNLMGRHVDHRGGFNNFLAIDRETLMVAGLRSDDTVIAVNTDPKKFKSQQFNISELIGRFAWSDWINFIESDWVRNLLRNTAGDWGNYLKAAMLRLQHKYHDLKINGLNIALSGNIPIAAGLSSSSSIVVATLQAAIALNGLDLTTRQFIDLCGEGEWFVGSRGGAGDHAAIYLGEKGRIVNVGYYPFQVQKIIEAPANYQVVIANSHIKAAKSSAAKHTFNQKICSYNLGFELLKLRCPGISNRLEYLRDVNPEKLGVAVSDIYRCLKKIPQFMTRKDFRKLLPGKFRELMELNFSTHNQPDLYNVRGVLLFGIAEIIRSQRCIAHLEKEEIEQFGQLMKISHNGDRVAVRTKRGSYHHLQDDCSDEYLDRLISDLASENPEKVLNAQLYMQPGSYGCSTKEIDRMVDIAVSVPGVAGAQIAGAGLGGCIMVLVRKEKVSHLRKALVRNYYQPEQLNPEIIPCTTVEGAGLVEFSS